MIFVKISVTLIIYQEREQISNRTVRISLPIGLKFNAQMFHSVMFQQISPVTGLEWPRGFQEVKVPRCHDNGTGWW